MRPSPPLSAPAHVDGTAEARIRHAGGRSTPDLLRRRETRQDAPDAVVSPADHDEVRACLDVAVARGIAVIPFGGGTSLVGALDPQRGAHHAVVKPRPATSQRCGPAG